MKFSTIITVFIIAFCSFAFQTTDPVTRIKFSEKNSRLEIDGFGNMYVITDNEIIKYSATGNVQKKFSTKRYGRIENIDAMNPLKVLVYYKDFQ